MYVPFGLRLNGSPNCSNSSLKYVKFFYFSTKYNFIKLLLWIIEDNIRAKEKLQQFDSEFIDLARRVYITNDERAKVKKQINLKSKSYLIEEKSHES